MPTLDRLPIDGDLITCRQITKCLRDRWSPAIYGPDEFGAPCLRRATVPGGYLGPERLFWIQYRKLKRVTRTSGRSSVTGSSDAVERLADVLPFFIGFAGVRMPGVVPCVVRPDDLEGNSRRRYGRSRRSRGSSALRLRGSSRGCRVVDRRPIQPHLRSHDR